MNSQLKLKYLGINTYREAVLYMRADCHVCRSEGFEVHTRVRITINDKSILATLNTIEGDLLEQGEVSLSNYAWQLLDAKVGEKVSLSHPHPLQSLSYTRSKVYGNTLPKREIQMIVEDIAKGHYSDIHIATFLTACAGGRLSLDEIVNLTRSMITVGDTLSWDRDMVVDKHCVGGLPGNRTSLIIVPIVTAFGLLMPKTSSRAITSPAGTADTMETLAPVTLDLKAIQRVVEQEGGCIAWGGGVNLSPADEILIRVESAMDLDSEGQLIASVLSKKISAGSNHMVIDVPVGPTAKVRTIDMAQKLQQLFLSVSKALDIHCHVLLSDGAQPVGQGIGPALEAYDVLKVLQNHQDAPKDLRDRSLTIAAHILEFSAEVKSGQGRALAEKLLSSGKAWEKFQAIANAQGGLREPPKAAYTHVIEAQVSGAVTAINNRQLARVAKLAGAPHDKAAGIECFVRLGSFIERGQPLFTLHAESEGELRYALSHLMQVPDIIQVEATD